MMRSNGQRVAKMAHPRQPVARPFRHHLLGINTCQHVKKSPLCTRDFNLLRQLMPPTIPQQLRTYRIEPQLLIQYPGCMARGGLQCFAATPDLAWGGKCLHVPLATDTPNTMVMCEWTCSVRGGKIGVGLAHVKYLCSIRQLGC